MNNEEMRILTGASLADKEAPVSLDTKKGGEFVAEHLPESKPDTDRTRRRLNILIPVSAVLGIAACLMVIFIVFAPESFGNMDSGIVSGTSTPVQMQEMKSVHASFAVADTVSCDSIENNTIKISE